MGYTDDGDECLSCIDRLSLSSLSSSTCFTSVTMAEYRRCRNDGIAVGEGVGW